MYHWTGSNNSTFMNGSRKAKTLQTATREALEYLRGELMQEGSVHIFKDGEDRPVLSFERSVHTHYRCMRKDAHGITTPFYL